MYVGKKLKELRVRLDMNQTQMANNLNVSQSYYSSIEKGKKPITNRLVEMIVEKFDIDRGYFEIESISKNITKEGVDLGGIIGGNGDNLVFDFSEEVNRLGFYLNHSIKRLKRTLAVTKDNLKEVINTYNKLVDLLHYFNAPDFILTEYAKCPSIQKFDFDIDEEIKEDYDKSLDDKTLVCIRILRHEDNISQIHRSIVLLVDDFDKNKDIFKEEV